MLDFGISQITGLFQLGERLLGYWQKWRKPPVPETLAGRFFRLFEAHGVHRNQIPRLFDHGLQLRDVQDEAALMQCLTDAHIADVCKLFGVERQWLERGEGLAHTRHSFYLHPVAFGQFLDVLLATKMIANVELQATLFSVPGPRRDVESTLLLAEPIKLLNGAVIYRYHYVEAGPLGYWKSRVSTAALVAQTIARDVWINGRHCDAKLLNTLTHHKNLIGLAEHDRLIASSYRFEVDDWLLEPNALLDGVDPEIDSYGTISALDLWLSLDTQGLVKHPAAKPGTRAKFEAALALQKATA